VDDEHGGAADNRMQPAAPAMTPRRRGRVVVYLLSTLAVVVGAVLLVVGVRASDHAESSRDRAAVARRQRTAVLARTRLAERDVDSPISDAERVAKSVTTIVSSADAVIVESADTNRQLGQAVALVNRGQRAQANAIYDGEAAASVQKLQDGLAQARAALAAAQAATTDLEHGSP
jgi:hypothetical protein